MADAGKGDSTRPRQISLDKWNANWDKAFKKKKGKKKTK